MIESIASSLNSSNLKQKESSCALDKIHALGLSAMHTPIGASSLRFIDALQPKAYNDLIFQLSREAGKKIKADKKIVLRLAKQVVHEHAFKFCKVCLGAKEQQTQTKIVTCPDCNGTGLHRHTDTSRANAIGLSKELYNKYWSEHFKLVQSIYTDHCRVTLRISKDKLNPLQ